MRRTPVVLGILSMIFGGLVAAYSAFGLATQSMAKEWSAAFSKMAALNPPRPGHPDPGKMMEGMGPLLDQLKPYTLSISGGMLLFSLALIGIGWGLYKRQAWSRPASLLWGAAALAFIPFQIWVQTAIIQPRMREMMLQAFTDANLPPAFLQSMLSAQGGITVVFTVLVYAPFPVVLLILMGRSSARNDLLA
jgi:hypothetical protein